MKMNRVFLKLSGEALAGPKKTGFDEETVKDIERVVLDIRGVECVVSMKTRLFGSRIYVDLEIEADKSLMLEQAFAIAKEVHDSIEKRFPQVKHCSVQVNPEGSRGLEGTEN